MTERRKFGSSSVGAATSSEPATLNGDELIAPNLGAEKFSARISNACRTE
jgi:hypothetical protein